MKPIPIILFTLFLIFPSLAPASQRIYTIASDLNIREKPDTKSRIIGKLPPAQWVRAQKHDQNWTRIYLDNDVTGFVHNKYITDIWIKIWKKERKLLLMADTDAVKKYDISLGFNANDDKHRQGDGCTPIGRFYVCEMLSAPQPKERYGARSIRISYPNLEDARRGLKDGLISKSQYLEILRQTRHMEMPLQNTSLGGSIRIHGGGQGSDWTLGCVAMNDDDIIDMFSRLPSRNTMVEIYQSRQEDSTINHPNFLNDNILKASKSLMKSGCKYTKDATGIIRMGFPLGDFDSSIGVCTDIVIRALRKTGIDLQALLYEDIIQNPSRYPNIQTPDTNIDHRRTRNLKKWFDHHAMKLANTPPRDAPDAWQAGDIVIMDTGVQNGTIYDHIGIVSDSKVSGCPLVINLWTIGYDIEEMDLLNGEYPEIVGHYRLMHIFDYSAVP